MDFESPDVEKDFPGLFASESVKKCNESDSEKEKNHGVSSLTTVDEASFDHLTLSDDNHDKSYKKELITGKKKDKRDSKKDRGYAALEGESSADENTDSKSPSKSKKSKSFKFPTKKSEKREKSREKDGKEKDPEKDKKKEKDKKEKDKIKLKDKKKNRHSEESFEFNGEYPVFNVDLETSVERSGCLDGVAIPLVVRNCIGCIHEYGLSLEGLYKTAGVKSKVLALKRAYDLREPVALKENDVFVATCLLKMFLRELIEPLLTSELLTRFEEAGAIMEVDAREIELQNLIQQLPYHNRILLSWLIVHFDTVTQYEKQNKLNAQSIAMTFSPVLQMSHRLLTAFLCHCKTLFPDTVVEKYVPPLRAGSPLPEKSDEIVNELRKQESLLNQIHKEMSQGFVSKKREEQLWEVQRIVTQLKRSLRIIQKSQETNAIQRSLDEDQSGYEEAATAPEEQKKQIPDKEEPDKAPQEEEAKDENSEAKEKISRGSVEDENPEPSSGNVNQFDGKNSKFTRSQASGNLPSLNDLVKNNRNLEVLRLQLEREHLFRFQNLLQDRLENERQLIERILWEMKSIRNESESRNRLDSPYEPEEEEKVSQLVEENNVLAKRKDELIRKIFEERLACLALKVNINLFEINGKLQASA